MCVNVCMSVLVMVRMCICSCVCVYICVCVCMCVCVGGSEGGCGDALKIGSLGRGWWEGGRGSSQLISGIRMTHSAPLCENGISLP